MPYQLSSNDKEIVINLYNSYYSLFWSNDGFRNKHYFRYLLTDWKECLLDFVDSYAFERSQVIKKYRDAAYQVINSYINNDTIIDDSVNKLVNEQYTKILINRIAINEDVNPFYEGRSIISLCRELDHYNLVNFAKIKIEQRNVTLAYDKIKNVRGVGQKIACLWLRDVGDAFDLDVNEVDDPRKMQPIDRHVYDYVLSFSDRYGWGLPVKQSNTKKSYWKAAEIMIEIARQCGLRHTLLNSAIWVSKARSASALRARHNL